ncbi:biogenesis of lysosomal organelles complex-1, subunit 1 [Mycotypha africana]|uniref:biogenesis of lysosomal organelles complex-1, subunit 1 n=1 Tax=Mycotypha africana TaxID=64632 RepID=UPI002301CA38|nr:biogenesis of lysosomal organelles complex-1, subunit 1 [Mycotypha africana]KAI8991977.1 biogenesis of lysosomal organelles complex-1, subunit 1 [Mycotypha africana]
MSSSLSDMLKAHNQKRTELKRQNEKTKKIAVQSTKDLTDALNDYVNEGVAEMLSKEKELEQHSRKLSTQISQYTNQTQQWLSLVDDFNASIKEMGDVRNWAEIMEQDMKAIMATLEFVHSGIPEDSIS